MAWLWSSEYDDFERDIWAAPRIKTIPHEIARFSELRKTLGEEIRAQCEGARVSMNSPSFPTFGSNGPLPIEGWRFPKIDRPFQSCFLKQQDEIIDIVTTGFGFGISERVIDLIEKIEPAVHNYLPVEFLQPDGTLYRERRWVLNICSRAECIDVGNSHVQWMNAPLDFYFMDLPGERRLVVNAESVAGKALWSEWRYAAGAFREFASDAFWEGLQQIGARGWVPKREHPFHIEEL